MTNEEIMELGSFAGHVLLSPYFETLTQAFETDCLNRFLQSKAADTVEREHVYNQLTGVREFLGFLTDFAAQGKKLAEKYETVKEEDIDDPSVHDIYAPDDLYTKD